MGAVSVNGSCVKASAEVRPGDRIRVDFAHRTLEIELVTSVDRNLSRAAAREVYRVLRDARVP